MKFIIALMFVGLVGCIGNPVNPQQSVFQIKEQYELALTVAVAYDNLPPCGVGVGPICSTPEVVIKLKQAKDVASPAVQAAENAVRDPSFNTSTASAVIASARAAVVALTIITATLQVKK